MAGDEDLPEFVREGTRDEQSQSFMLAKPWSSKASGLTFKTWVRRTSDGCLEGDASGSVAPFTFRAEGSATWCDGRVVAALGNHALPMLRVGDWFATQAVEGEPNDPQLVLRARDELASRASSATGSGDLAS